MPKLRARMSDRGSRVGETPVRAAVAACRRCGTLSGVGACPLAARHPSLPCAVDVRPDHRRDSCRFDRTRLQRPVPGYHTRRREHVNDSNRQCWRAVYTNG